MANIDRRIAALEEAVVQLRMQLEQASKAPTPAPPKAEERQVSVTLASQINSGFVMPNETQLRQLFDIAVKRFPILKAGVSIGRFREQDENNLYSEYRTAFKGLGSIGRTQDGSIDPRWTADHWIMMINARGFSLVGTLPFTAAAIAHNDIAFRFDTHRMASSACFGLYDGGVAATDKWRRVIETNSTRDPLPLPFSRDYGVGYTKATA